MKRIKELFTGANIISYILSFITIGVGIMIDCFAGDGIVATSSSFYVSVLVLLIGQKISVYQEIKKLQNESKALNETVKTHLDVIKMGTPKSAWNYIISRLDELEYVQNTSLNYDKEIDKSSVRFYKNDNYTGSLSLIAEAINNGLAWTDIGDEFAIERFTVIKNKVNKNHSDKYMYRVIAHDEPQIGFILLTYTNGIKEVLFNWDYRDIPGDPVVLLSREEIIFDMFSAQFQQLWGSKSDNYDRIATKSTS